jgi:signal transduction histidine kinase
MQTETCSVERIGDRPMHARRPDGAFRVRERTRSRPDVLRCPGGPRSIDAAVRQERARIGRELHDGVSQTLYAIALAAYRARILLPEDDGNEVRQLIDHMLELANAGQSDIRALLANLRGGLLTSGGLTAGLTDLAADVRARTGLDISLALADEPDVPIAIKEALALISREALHNVARHARANRADIVLEDHAGSLVLSIVDDGAGFDPAVPRPGHYGLQTMRERATVIGGSLQFLSADGAGTQVRVCVPRASGHDEGVGPVAG